MSEKKTEESKVEKQLDNIVYIGKNLPLHYASQAIYLFNSGHDEICLKARGFPIYKAIETVEMVKKIFMKDAKIIVKIGSEEIIDRKTNRPKILPTIEIKIGGKKNV